MSGDLSADDHEHPPRAGPPEPVEPALVATVVEYSDVPNECTIHPSEPGEDELMTCWVTALEDSFISLRDAR